MPRTKEAIAVLRGFCKFQAKGESGDALFAKGILAALRWMTEEESPIPFAELAEDLDNNGGWEAAQPIGLRSFTKEESEQAAKAVVARVAQEDDPYAALPKTLINTSSVTQLLDATGAPILNIDTSGIGNNNKVLLPGSYEAAAKEHPWLAEVGRELSSLHKGTPSTDRNTVVVGGGLGDSPLSDDYGGYDE